MITHPPVLGGSTNYSCVLRVVDATDGTPETGVSHDTSGIDLKYQRAGGTVTDITEAALASPSAAHADGGVEHLNNGYIRVDLPDAAVAAGVPYVSVFGTITGMVVIGAMIPIVAYNPSDGVRLGLTALPNAAADAAGGLPISDAGGLDMDAILADTNELQADDYPTTLATLATAAALATAQADLDVLTGTDGATLATAQGNYAPAKAGDAMALTAGERTSTATAVWASATRTLTSVSSFGLATAAKLLAYVQLLARKDAAIETDNATELTEINADGGSGAGAFSAQTDSGEAIRDHVGDGTNLTEAGGNGDHLTEAGGTGDQLTALGTAAELAKVPKSDGTVSWNATALAAINAEADTALADYDPPTKAELDSGFAGLNDLSAAQVNAEVDTALGDYDGPTRAEATADKAEILALLQGLILASGTIGSTGNDTTHLHLTGLTYGDDEINDCLLVIFDVSTSEYHARWVVDWADTGDLATVATLPFTPQDGVDTYWLLPVRQDVTGGSGLDAAGVRAAVGLAAANLDTQLGDIQTTADAVETDTQDLQTQVGTAGAGLTDLGGMSTAMKAEVNAEADTALSDYDAPTKAELDSGLAGLNDPTSAAIADAVWDEAKAGHVGAGSFGEEVQAHALTSEVSAVETDTQDIQSRLPAALVSGRMSSDAVAVSGSTVAADAVEANIGNLDDAVSDAVAAPAAALTSYDPPTKAELDSGLAGLNDPTAAAIADAVLDEALAGHTTAGTLGKAVADTEGDVASVLVDTNEVQTDLTNGGRLDLLIDAIKAVTDVIPDSGAMTSIAQASALTTVDTVVDAIKVITDALGATAAARLALSAGQMVPGTVDTSAHTPTTTEFEADDITEATADHYIGRVVVFTSGALAGQVTDITDYALSGANGHLTVTALTEAAANDDTFIIV